MRYRDKSGRRLESTGTENWDAAQVAAYGENWTSGENLAELGEELDRLEIPVPKTGAMRADGGARSWSRGRQYYPNIVIKAIKDRCKAAHVATD
jgi:hypothetical protein